MDALLACVCLRTFRYAELDRFYRQYTVVRTDGRRANLLSRQQQQQQSTAEVANQSPCLIQLTPQLIRFRRCRAKTKEHLRPHSFGQRTYILSSEQLAAACDAEQFWGRAAREGHG
jgi:hypothetical protein